MGMDDTTLARKRRIELRAMQQRPEGCDSPSAIKRQRTVSEEIASEGAADVKEDAPRKKPSLRGIKKQARYEPGVPMTKEELTGWRKEARRFATVNRLPPPGGKPKNALVSSSPKLPRWSRSTRLRFSGSSTWKPPLCVINFPSLPTFCARTWLILSRRPLLPSLPRYSLGTPFRRLRLIWK